MVTYYVVYVIDYFYFILIVIVKDLVVFIVLDWIICWGVIVYWFLNSNYMSYVLLVFRFKDRGVKCVVEYLKVGERESWVFVVVGYIFVILGFFL